MYSDIWQKEDYLNQNYKQIFLEMYPTLEAIEDELETGEDKIEDLEAEGDGLEIDKHPLSPRPIQISYLTATIIGGIFVILVGIVIFLVIDRLVHPITPTVPPIALASSPTNTPIINPTNTPNTFNPTNTAMPVLVPIANTATYTASPTNTPLPSPTDTETPIPSVTPSPLPTNTPTPSLALPFVDNFDNGLRPEWQLVKGNPVFKNGGIGSLSGELDLSLGDATLSNYALEFDYSNISFNCAGCLYIEVLIGTKIRYSMRGGLVGGASAFLDAYDNNQWANLLTDPVPARNGHLKLKIVGNQFNLSLDSKVNDSVTYGSALDERGPIIVTINNGGFIGNFSITRP